MNLDEWTDLVKPNARNEALVAFSLFHADPAKYRQAVAKSGIASMLHRSEGRLARSKLLMEVEKLLGVTSPSHVVPLALRNLE